jgi:PTH1 family peptidyl-tRNA hydrolase
LAAVSDIPIEKQKFKVHFGRGRIGDHQVVLAKPQDYMNRSGPPLYALTHFFKIPLQAMIIIHDDIDLAYERLKIKEKGGDGGHKGIRSIINAFGADQFVRVRMGVGRPEGERDVVGHVLDAFTPAEKQLLDKLLERTCEAIVTILTKGTLEGMNRFNRIPH